MDINHELNTKLENLKSEFKTIKIEVYGNIIGLGYHSTYTVHCNNKDLEKKVKNIIKTTEISEEEKERLKKDTEKLVKELYDISDFGIFEFLHWKREHKKCLS